MCNQVTHQLIGSFSEGAVDYCRAIFDYFTTDSGDHEIIFITHENLKSSLKRIAQEPS